MRSSAWSCVLKFVWIAVLSSGCAIHAAAQVSPNEILDPQLKALEKEYFAQLKTINQEIAKSKFSVSLQSQSRGRAGSCSADRS